MCISIHARLNCSYLKNKYNMTQSDPKKLKELFKTVCPDKTVLITSHSWYSSRSTAKRLQKYDVHCLDQSHGPKNINNDELFQKLKSTVIHTAHLSCDQARDCIKEHVQELYPGNYVNIFVWNAGNMNHHGFTGCTAHAKFKASQNKYYGHDVLVILN